MTNPEPSQQQPPPAHPRAAKVLLSKEMTIRRAAQIIATATVTVSVVAGILMHLTDPKQFPNVGIGLWWAIQTVTTVGYGDVVPKSVAGRLIASLVMLLGIGFLTVITATITATFIESKRRQLQGASDDVVSAKLDQLGARLDAIEVAVTQSHTPRREGPQ